MKKDILFGLLFGAFVFAVISAWAVQQPPCCV